MHANSSGHETNMAAKVRITSYDVLISVMQRDAREAVARVIAFAEAAEQQFDDDAGPRGCMWRSSRRSRHAFLAGSTSRSVKLHDEHEGRYGDVADCAHMPWEADEQDPEPPHYSAAAAAARAAAARNTDREDPERDSRMCVS
jgi:hypothetical protein